MPKNRPNIGDTNWGQTLNNHLSQISPVEGGLNSGTTAQRPTLGANDDGFTYLDTITQELLKWNGTAWETLLKGNSNPAFGGIGAPMPFDLSIAESFNVIADFSQEIHVPVGRTMVITKWGSNKLGVSGINTWTEITLPTGDNRVYNAILFAFREIGYPINTSNFQSHPVHHYIKDTGPGNFTPANQNLQTYAEDTLIYLPQTFAIEFIKTSFSTMFVSGYWLKNTTSIQYFSIILINSVPTYIVPNGKRLYLTSIIAYMALSQNSFTESVVDTTSVIVRVGGTSPTQDLVVANNQYINQYAKNPSEVRQFPAGTTFSLVNPGPNTNVILSGYLVNS